MDVEESTMNIHPASIEAAITERTKAIMPVHLFGLPAKMDMIMELAQKHGISVVEDCAQSTGATIGDRKAGSIGHVAAFSFFPTKNLGAFGDGGLITTNDDRIAEAARMLRVHGAKSRYNNEVLGYNSRLDSMQAAILRVKLPHLDEYNQQRRRVATVYNTHLSKHTAIITPKISEGHVFHQYTIRITNNKRNQLHEHLKENNIISMIYYEKALHQLPVYQGQYERFPISELLANQVLSLPIWPELDDGTIEYVCKTILDYL